MITLDLGAYSKIRFAKFFKGIEKHYITKLSFQVLVTNQGFKGMAIRAMEFSNGGYKISKIFAKESTYSKEIIEFCVLD